MFRTPVVLPQKSFQVLLISRSLVHRVQYTVYLLNELHFIESLILNINIEPFSAATVHASIGAVIILRIIDAFCIASYMHHINFSLCKKSIEGASRDLIEDAPGGMVDHKAVEKHFHFIGLLILRVQVHGIPADLALAVPYEGLLV